MDFNFNGAKLEAVTNGRAYTISRAPGKGFRLRVCKGGKCRLLGDHPTIRASMDEAEKWEEKVAGGVSCQLSADGAGARLDMGDCWIRPYGNSLYRVEGSKPVEYGSLTDAINHVLTNEYMDKPLPDVGLQLANDIPTGPYLTSSNGCQIRRGDDTRFAVWVPVYNGVWEHLRAIATDSLREAVEYIASHKEMSETSRDPKLFRVNNYTYLQFGDRYKIRERKHYENDNEYQVVKWDDVIWKQGEVFPTLEKAVNSLPAEIRGEEWPEIGLRLGEYDGRPRLVAPDDSRIGMSSNGDFCVWIFTHDPIISFHTALTTDDINNAVRFLANRLKEKDEKVIRTTFLQESTVGGDHHYYTWLGKEDEILGIRLNDGRVYVDFLGPKSIEPTVRHEFCLVGNMTPVPEGAKYMGQVGARHAFMMSCHTKGAG